MNNLASKTAEEETRMMDLSQDGTGPASSTSVPDDSILDKSDDDIEELEQMFVPFDITPGKVSTYF